MNISNLIHLSTSCISRLPRNIWNFYFHLYLFLSVLTLHLFLWSRYLHIWGILYSRQIYFVYVYIYSTNLCKCLKKLMSKALSTFNKTFFFYFSLYFFFRFWFTEIHIYICICTYIYALYFVSISFYLSIWHIGLYCPSLLSVPAVLYGLYTKLTAFPSVGSLPSIGLCTVHWLTVMNLNQAVAVFNIYIRISIYGINAVLLWVFHPCPDLSNSILKNDVLLIHEGGGVRGDQI